MKGKYVIALIVLACAITWFAGWLLYDTLALWQTIQNARFSNYLIIVMILEAIAAISIQIRLQKHKQPLHDQITGLESLGSHSQKEPMEDSPFIQLVARVNSIENEQHQMKKDIKGLRVFKRMIPEEEAKPDV